MYNSALKKLCRAYAAHYIDVANFFNKWDRVLWSKADSIHLSSNQGVPLLIQEVVSSLMRSAAAPEKPVEVNRSFCPEWLWRELKHHNSLGM